MTFTLSTTMASGDTENTIGTRCPESDDEEDDGMWDDEEEEGMEMLNGPVRCLFCDGILQSVDEAFRHCQDSHQLNILQIARRFSLDCIGYIKMINYIRKQKPSPSSLSSLTLPVPWASDDFMQPSDHDDLLLQYDIESVETSSIQRDTDQRETTSATCGTPELEQRAMTAEVRAKQAEEELRRAVADLEKVRSFMKTLMSTEPEVKVTHSAPSIQSLQADEDEAYFSSYSHFGIHQEMLKDKVRTESYRDLMLKNKDLFADKVVLDVGCGTGILSMFAARAGARLVIGVDQSEIIYQAMDIVRENDLSDKVTLLKGRLEDVKLPVDKVDIIVSEWMGYFLLFESMLDTVLYARDTYLKEDGIVFPDRCTLSLVGSGDLDLHGKHISFWDDVYGFKMSCMKAEVIHEAIVELVEDGGSITQPCVVKELDACRCRLDDLQFESPFCLTCTHDGCLSAIVGYFDIFFEKGCNTKVSFSTSPGSPTTHWKQTVFLLDKPRTVRKGEKLEGKVVCKKNRKDPRSLVITIDVAGVTHRYIME
ncbi:protein arginine N-methyltransferase 3-like isoform X2 [Haliotis rufescens]|uniref:protein arginine N-methyltransferase 3-like isoform X2 n=1 Tax=Haliotis rufescens TaxID=6454 RepID=UPI00201F851F|nr:protein arginine N-methyltransferase 3-like isoform X2 [Haliotis rufescens]